MKTENTSDADTNSESKQVWTKPTLTILSMPLDTHSLIVFGGDGGPVAGSAS